MSLGASPSKNSVARLKRMVGDLLRRANQAPWPVVRDRLNSMLDGWSRDVGHGTRVMAYRTVDNDVYECVRDFLVRRHKVPSRGITRWEHEHVVEAVEHPFGAIESWMGSTHFLMKTLKRVGTEMALHVLAYNLKRVMNIPGIRPPIAAMMAA